MAKTEKELAFLRDLYVTGEWTQRFTELVDKHINLKGSENMLYINAGTGGHAMVLQEKFGAKTDIFARCEDEHLLMIARDKAAAVRSEVDFSTLSFEDDSFDAVLTDASMVRPAELQGAIENAVRTARTGADIALFVPTAGSFGEIFSLMWEVLLDEEVTGHTDAVETMIAELPTVSRLETMAENAGLVNVNTETANEIFEFENGAEFIASPLVADFLLQGWLADFTESEKERVMTKLAGLIDAEDGTLTFRFSVKATLLSGEKG